MRAPLIFGNQASPLAAAFSDIAKNIATAPSPEERALHDAQSRLYSSQADKAAREEKALGSFQGGMASLFAPHTAGISATPQSFVGPVPTGGLTMESPAEVQPRRDAGLASLFANMGKENAAAAQQGMITSRAMSPNVDDRFVARLLSGGSLGPDLTVSAEEGNRIRNDESRIRQADEANKIALTPETDGQQKARIAQGMIDRGEMPPAAMLKYVGALPTKGMRITTNADGTMGVDMGGDNDASGLTVANTSGQQKSLIHAQALSKTLDSLDAIVAEHPKAVGIGGLLSSGAQGSVSVAKSIASTFGGEKQFNEAFEEAQKQAAKYNLDLHYDPSMNELDKLGEIATMQLAATLAGDNPNGISKSLYASAKQIIGDPNSVFTSPEQFMSNLKMVRGLANDSISQSSGIIKKGGVGGLVNTSPANPAPPKVNGADLIAKARVAIRNGKDPEGVRAKLSAMGVDPAGL